MPIQIDGATYLTRKDLVDRGWEMENIKKFPHDKTQKSPTGRGRPSYLYLESRVIDKEGGKPVAAPAIEHVAISKPGYNFVGDMDHIMDKVAAHMDEVNVNDAAFLKALDDVNEGKATAHIEGNEFVVCAKPQAISEPKATPKPAPKAFYGVPYGPKPQGLVQAVIVDEQGNETSVTL